MSNIETWPHTATDSCDGSPLACGVLHEMSCNGWTDDSKFCYLIYVKGAFLAIKILLGGILRRVDL